MELPKDLKVSLKEENIQHKKFVVVIYLVIPIANYTSQKKKESEGVHSLKITS